MKRKSLQSNFLNITVCSMLWISLSVPNLKAQDDIIIFDIGSFSLSLLSEGQGNGGTNILIGATSEMVKKVIPDGTFPMATNAFLVETGTKTWLLDAGVGRKTIDNLAPYGKKASDIDAIFISHFHGDHTGSLLIEGQKSYPNATLYIAKPEYDYYMSDAEMAALPENRRGGFSGARAIFNAYKDKIVIFTPYEIDKAVELAPGIKGVAAYGHTPGHVGFLLESDGQQLFYWGDMTHAMAIQMPFPEVALAYDTDPVKAVECRRKLLQYLADKRISVAGAHIPFPGMGDLKKSLSEGYDFTLMCTCGGRMP